MSQKLDLGFILWAVRFLLAALGLAGKADTPSAEQLPDGHPDAKPAPKLKVKPTPTPHPKGKYPPVSTAPGTWNRVEGRWNE